MKPEEYLAYMDLALSLLELIQKSKLIGDIDVAAQQALQARVAGVKTRLVSALEPWEKFDPPVVEVPIPTDLPNPVLPP